VDAIAREGSTTATRTKTNNSAVKTKIKTKRQLICRMATSLKLVCGALLLLHLITSDATLLKQRLKLNANERDLPIIEEPEEIDFPKSSDQTSRVPRAISYGWTKADCDAAAAKHPCQKCKCTNDDCLVLTESCTEDPVCPLVEDKPIKNGPCCPTCPTYGDGSLEALEEECNRRAVEQAEQEGELCPSVCVCVQDGPFPVCSKEPVRMCAKECHTKYGSDPCARCECEEGGPCTLIMQVQSEPFCGEGMKPIAKEGVCGLTCPQK